VATLRQQERQLAHLALHDPLTGLPNRARFTAACEALGDGGGRPPAVLFIDLDGFKEVNDRLGHAAGDQILQQVAQRLLSCLDDDILLARFGGDEFVALVPRGEAAADRLGARVLGAITIAFTVDGEVVHLGASVGVAAVSEVGHLHEALRRADAAMYVAKTTGKGRLVRYPDATVLTVPPALRAWVERSAAAAAAAAGGSSTRPGGG
jgi:diguanylate cyclase (GGDEF)-like protein